VGTAKNPFGFASHLLSLLAACFQQPGLRLASRWRQGWTVDINHPHGGAYGFQLAPVAHLGADAYALHPSGHGAAAIVAATTAVAVALRDRNKK
jgi:hypothetical protein